MLNKSVQPKDQSLTADSPSPGVSVSGTSPDDKQIWQAFKSGDEGAFIHIYNTYFNSLYHYCQQFSKDNNLIKDCIQDLFISLRKNRSNLSETNSIKLYLFKSMKRLVLRTKKSRQRFCSADEVADETFPLTLSHEHHLITRQLNTEKKLKLQRALNNLPSRQKEVIYYRFYQNLTYPEISELMDFSDVKSVRNLVYRAFKSLKQSL